MCSCNRVFEEPHHAYGCRLHKTTFRDMHRKTECSEVNMMVQIWQRVGNPLWLAETFHGAGLWRSDRLIHQLMCSKAPRQHTRDTVSKNLWLVRHWKHCDTAVQRKISWSTSRQLQDCRVKRIYLAYMFHLVNGKRDLFRKIFLCWLHQQD